MNTINLAEVWNNALDDTIEMWRECLDFSKLSREEFKEECVSLIKYYFDNEMIEVEPNYRNIVFDTAKSYEMLEGQPPPAYFGKKFISKLYFPFVWLSPF